MRVLHQSVLHKDGSVEHPQTQVLQCMSTSEHSASRLVWSGGTKLLRGSHQLCASAVHKGSGGVDTRVLLVLVTMQMSPPCQNCMAN